MDEDTLYEMRRTVQLDVEEAYFLSRYSIPDGFRAWTNYKQGDKYVIELSNNDKKCKMKLEIDREFYDFIDDFVTTCDIETLNVDDIIEYVDENYVEGGEK